MYGFFKTYTVVCLGLAAQALLNIGIVALMPNLSDMRPDASIIWLILTLIWLVLAKNPFIRGMLYNTAIMALMMYGTGFIPTLGGQAAALGFYLVLALVSFMLAFITMPEEEAPKEKPSTRSSFSDTGPKRGNNSRCDYCGRNMWKAKNQDDEFEYICPGCGSFRLIE